VDLDFLKIFSGFGGGNIAMMEAVEEDADTG
jgi:hypothetical protein